MREIPPHGFEGYCLRCLMRREVCLCDRIPRVETRVRFLIVQHSIERLRTSNTGKLAALALPNCEVLEYGGPEPIDPARLSGPHTWLLYPSPMGASGPPPDRLVVLDGTWHQSRKMYSRLAPLRAMPCLALPAPEPGQLRLRRPPRADGMSTLEAIAAAVGVLEGPGKARELLALHDEHAARVLALKGVPRTD